MTELCLYYKESDGLCGVIKEYCDCYGDLMLCECERQRVGLLSAEYISWKDEYATENRK